MLALAALLACLVSVPRDAAAESGTGEPSGRVVIAVLPYGTSVEEIAEVPGLAPGVVSSGLGSVPVAQTFLDIGQGNRVNQPLYDEELPRLYLSDGRVPPRLWRKVVARAESAPAKIVPGLLASTLIENGVPVAAEADSGLATLLAVDREGEVRIVEAGSCDVVCGPGLSLLRAQLDELPGLAVELGPDDLLIALAAGARAEQELLPIGISGEGYLGNLTSSSTRTDGVITTTDIAPTVLDWLGIEIPDEVNGSEIVSGDERDPAAVADLQEQLDTRPSRETVALMPLAIWLALCGLVALIWRRPGASVALRLLGVSCAIAPGLLLAAAALDASTLVSALLLGVGSVLLAGLALWVLGDLVALALACGLTVGAYAVDVVVGSPLTALSVLGPNPGYGVRFFGIGNELEAILTTLALIGTGAAISARPSIDRRRAAFGFGAVALVATLAFAPGRFGADVGAAIVLGVGGATAAVLALGLDRRRALLAVIGGGALAIGALFAIDLILGGAHLSRSVIGAGGAGDLLDVIERRVTLMSETFIHPVYPELLATTAVLLVLGFVRRSTVLGWFGDRWAARCGYLGAVAGVLVGTVANDSGSVLLVLGTIYLGVGAGFYWAGAEARRAAGEPGSAHGARVSPGGERGLVADGG